MGMVPKQQNRFLSIAAGNIHFICAFKIRRRATSIRNWQAAAAAAAAWRAFVCMYFFVLSHLSRWCIIIIINIAGNKSGKSWASIMEELIDALKLHIYSVFVCTGLKLEGSLAQFMALQTTTTLLYVILIEFSIVSWMKPVLAYLICNPNNYIHVKCFLNNHERRRVAPHEKPTGWCCVVCVCATRTICAHCHAIEHRRFCLCNMWVM